MEIFEYISVLTSIIVGLGIAHLLRGIAQLIQHPGRYTVYWVHLVWVAYMFFQMAFWWWWQFNLLDLPAWQFQNYMFLLIYAVILFLICALLFPTDLDDYSGFEEYYFSRRKWFFGLLAASFLIDLYDTWLKGAEHFFSLGPQYIFQEVAYVTLSIVAMSTQRRPFHAFFAISAFMYQIYWAFEFWGTQG